MLTTILSTVCALSLGTSAISSPADTTNVYMINGKKIVNFDGSQLVGKTVKTYEIFIATNDNNGKVSKVHTISTNESSFVTNGSPTLSMENVYFVDDKVVSDTVNIKPERIKSVTVYQVGSKEAVELSGKDNVNVVKIDLKKKTIHIVDGKIISSQDFVNKLKPKKITSMTIYKAGSEEALKWTDDKDVEVVKVDMKK